jgi:integrase
VANPLTGGGPDAEAEALSASASVSEYNKQYPLHEYLLLATPTPCVAAAYLSSAGRRGGFVMRKTAASTADKAWSAAGLERLTFHECRHAYAGLMIAAGVNAKALPTYMGRANISITLDRYGHLMPGDESEAAGLLDAYLRSQREQADYDARSATPANPILR